MKPSIRKPKPRSAGFALVVTLSLMILLTVIAVGLLTLSSISLRAGSQASAASTARSNARLALMLALGELQSSLGPDQGVSATAAAVGASTVRPHLTGAWQRDLEDSQKWTWTPTTGGAPDYTKKADRFKGWLVSAPSPEDAEDFTFASAGLPAGADAVTLVGNPKTPNDSQDVPTTVVASKVKVGGKTRPGKFGWAVFDENAKAAVDLGDPSTSPTPGVEIASRTVPDRFRADVLDSALSSLKNPVNLVSLDTAAVAAGGEAVRPEFRKRFHDFTTGSIGLLTNTAAGGLKIDLTSLFEPATLPADAFTGANSTTPYPPGFNPAAGAPQWAYIRDHYRKYKYTTVGSNGETSYKVNDSKVKDLTVLNTGATTGVIASPVTERLLPVIAKFQLVFSLVSHEVFNVYNRRAFWDAAEPPGTGHIRFAVVNLAYDPVVTLYNPYDVTLDLAKTRIRIWDPPVGFKFTKVDNKSGTRSLFRDPSLDTATSGFVGLARFQRTNQMDTAARKCFTLVLADGTSEALGTSLKLKPGEVKVFSPRVQNSWNWALETSSGMSVKTFFDFEQGLDFGNKDGRTGNAFGIEAVPGWQFRAGLQTDHLATDNPGRYPPSKYSFDPSNEGFVTLRKTDAVQVEIKPLVTAGNATKNFQVDVLAGLQPGSTATVDVENDTQNLGVTADTLRSYRFNFNVTGASKDPSQEISATPGNPIIKKEYLAGAIYQEPDKFVVGGKQAVAMLEMTARTAKEELTDSKPWLYNNLVVEGGEQNSSAVGLTHQSYDLRLISISSLKDFPNGIAVDPDTNHGYFGANGSAQEGSSFVPMLHVPVAPVTSLGELIPANLASSSQLPRVVHPFGNSRAHPLIPANSVTQGAMMDHSYLLNQSLWDAYYFSTFTAYGSSGGLSGGVITESRTIKEVLKGVFSGSKPALNNRLVNVTQGDPVAMSDAVSALGDVARSRQIAKYVGVKGAFNLNSTSVDAWRAVLSSLRDRQVNGLNPSRSGSGPGTTVTLAKTTFSNSEATPFVRTGRPLAGSTPPSGLRWAGFRSLNDDQIKDLAQRIVVEIKARGAKDKAPLFSVGEFVNRRLGSSGQLHALAGLLQTAIDNSSVNTSAIGANNPNSKVINGASISAIRKTGVKTAEVLNGQTAEGSPVMVTQGDLLGALAPIATVRGDTFKIRAYGEATSADGTGVLARAWCEAVVQRVPDFVDSRDAAETVLASLSSPANIAFGRRFNIVSFRWLNEQEL